MSACRHEIEITYVGGPTAVLSIDGLKFITDPTFDPAGGDYASGTVSLLFGGGAQVRGPFYLTMDTNDAVETAVAFHDAVIVPVHHDGWAHFTQSQDDLARTFQALGMAKRLRRVTGGETMRLG